MAMNLSLPNISKSYYRFALTPNPLSQYWERGVRIAIKVTPTLFKTTIAVDVIAHRLVMEPQWRFAGRTAAGAVEEILHSIPVPN
jgi:hypothetical protein